MKFYLIPPNNNLGLMEYGDSYFCLAHHYLNNSSYKEYFLDIKKNNPKAFITLDNGSAEHSIVDEKSLLSIVKELKPDEVIAPDILFDKDQTLVNLYSFVVKMVDLKYHRHTKIFGCPQGQTKQEWKECFEQMAMNPLVSTIGLSKIAVPKCWKNVTGDTAIAEARNECVEELRNTGWMAYLITTKKSIHLLGMGEHTEFDAYVSKYLPIRSSDSCYTALAALNNISFETGDITRVPTTNDYFDTVMSEDQIELAIKNIEFLKRKYGHNI